ncbi:MAG: PhzF family phenazine biosynthesis protein [Proteobacteria bacterium]|nr:PhzF family phenazine biosynthesis protein [Pseudomonadota bacterium]
MNLPFCTVDVFTEQRFGGNPLAVFVDAPELPDELMQSIAREFNLSETVFIVKPRDSRAKRRLRIFTTARELPFAGHPTIGAAQVLVEQGLAGVTGDMGSFLFEEGVGLVPINVRRQRNGAWFVQLTTAKLPQEGPAAPPIAELAKWLNVAESDILQQGDFPQFYSCGVPFLFVPLRDRGVLSRISVDPTIGRRIRAAAGAAEVFAFSYDPEREGSDIRARMFAEGLGVAEDPATGSAAAALAGYLGPRAGKEQGTLQWTIEQGFEMGRPSIIHLEADMANGAVAAVRVGGTAVRVSDGVLR